MGPKGSTSPPKARMIPLPSFECLICKYFSYNFHKFDSAVKWPAPVCEIWAWWYLTMTHDCMWNSLVYSIFILEKSLSIQNSTVLPRGPDFQILQEKCLMVLNSLYVSLISWFSINFSFTAPDLQAPNVRPYPTPDADRDAYTLSITFRRDFFSENNGPVANYSILVVEWPHPSKIIKKI